VLKTLFLTKKAQEFLGNLVEDEVDAERIGDALGSQAHFVSAGSSHADLIEPAQIT
jgi:hypothetical protein